MKPSRVVLQITTRSSGEDPYIFKSLRRSVGTTTRKLMFCNVYIIFVTTKFRK